MVKMNMRTLFLPGGIILVGSLILMGGVFARQPENQGIEYSKVLNPELDFSLTDQDGNNFHLRDHRGKVVLLFFGYLTCPDICPVTLSKLTRACQLLGDDQARKILTVFITVDPQRDTPEKLKEYLKYFKLNVVGLTGTKEEIDRVVNSYKASYQQVDVDSAAGYLMDHSDLVYVIDGQGRVVDLVHFDDETGKIAQIIRKVI